MLQVKEEVIFEGDQELLIKYDSPYETYATEEVKTGAAYIIPCPQCDRRFVSKSQLKNHMWRHTGNKPFKCYVCQAGFTQHGNLKAHLRIHSGEKPFKCTECHLRFTQMSNLKSHMKIHTGEKPFKCDVCQAAFRQATNLKTHQSIHTGERPHVCNICGKTFTQKSNLKAHVRRMHPELPDSMLAQQQHPMSLSYQVQTSSIAQPEIHVMSETENVVSQNGTFDFYIDGTFPVHNIEVQPEISDEKPHSIMINEVDEVEFEHSSLDSVKLDKTIYVEPHTESSDLVCAQCLHKCSTKTELLKHSWLHRHQRNISCLFCSDTFKDFFNFKLHLNSHCSSFSCALCHLRFPSLKKLKAHCQCHTTRSFSCVMCGLSFRNMSSLRQHQHNTHRKLLPFSYKSSKNPEKELLMCSLCSHQFSSRASLITHRTLHFSAPKLLRCGHCSAKFSHISLLECHEKSHHTKMGRVYTILASRMGKKFACPNCKRSFHSLKALRVHLRKKITRFTAGRAYTQSYWQLIKESVKPAHHLLDESPSTCFVEMYEDPIEVAKDDVILNISCTDKTNVSRKPNPIFTCHDCRAYFTSLPKIKDHMKNHLAKKMKSEQASNEDTVFIISEDFNLVQMKS